ncbi:galanin receptor type 1-like, partial [Uloborus diversus]|uniref:galanin receptor type 1-like n=1 Tax=Uloborus diversus TaxID=327109 RepID=UPI002409A584
YLNIITVKLLSPSNKYDGIPFCEVTFQLHTKYVKKKRMENRSCGSGRDVVCEEPTKIFFETPEDMLNPLAINPSFMPIVITHAIIFLLGIIGNTVVIVTWAGSKPTRSPTCTFLVSLAVADLLLLVIYVPLETLGYFVITWDAGGTVCKLSSYVEMLSGMASVLNLTAVSIERFLVIAHPITARRYCTAGTCRTGLCIVWGAAIFLAFPVCFTKRIYPITYFNNSTSITAFYCWDSNDSVAFGIAIYQLVAIFLLPAVFMTACYICVIRELWSSTRTVAAMTRPNENDLEKETCKVNNPSKIRFTCSRQQRAPRSKVLSIHRQGLEVQHARKQVIKMLILVIVLFMICWGPRLIMHVLIKHGLSTFTVHVYNLRIAVYLLSFIHSAINPVIYGFMSSNFRKMMLQCCKDGVCGKMTCSICGRRKKTGDRPQRRTLSDSYEFSTLTTSTRRSRLANSINVDDARMRRTEEQWTTV